MEIRLKRFLSLAMAIIMVVSMMPANIVFATENTACEHTAKTETTVAATCTENGSVTETCDACGAVISQTVIGAGHKYEGIVTKAPACTEAGEKTFTCAVCGDSYTESVGALGHSTEETVTKTPTCTEAGEKTVACSACDYEETVSIDALGHSTEETVTKAPTCTEAGEKTVTCTVCEFSETVAVDALGHTYDEGEVTTEATCTVDGVKTFTCTVCGDSYTEAIAAAGHTFDAEGNCACGEKQIEATANEHTEHSYEMGSAKCTACDYVEEGYLLFILNGDGSVGMSIDGSKSVSAFCLRTALEDARVFANNAFLFGITGTPSYVVYMYEDSTENASFEIGADVTINGNGHKIVCAEGVTVTNNGTLNDVEIVETKPACEHPTHGTDGKCECGATVAHTYTDGKCTVCGAVDPDYVAPAPTEVVVATLAELQEALADNTNDLPIVVTETITIPAGETVTLNLNGKTIIATDNKAANVSYELFYIYGGLTVTGNGTIELTSTSNDTSWAKSSTIFHNRGGVLVIQSGTFTHKGGTAMAYVVDNNANSYGNATTTIKGGNLSSTYVAIRNRMDTYGANGGGNGVATLNIEGGSLSGKRAVWGQVSSAGCKGNITITGGNFSAWEGEPAVRVGTDETGEIVTAISGGTFTSDVSAYVVEGYVQNENGTVTVAPSEPEAPTEVKVATLAELQTAMDDNSNDLPIVVTETITIPAGETVVIDLNSKTVTSVYQTDSTTKHIYPLDVYGNLTIKDTKGNGTITGRGIFVRSGSKLTIDGGSIYAIDSNGGSALFMYGGEVVINGGHIEQKAEGTYNFAIQAPDGATVTVNGGWVGGNHGAIAATGAAVVINDGTFVCTGTAGMTDNVLYSDSNGSIIINGGNFVADKDIPAGGTCVYDANGGVTINGGTFGNSSGGDVWGVTGTTIKGGTFENLIETQHIADGYELGEDGTVIKKQPAAPAVTVDEVKVVITDNGNNSYDVVLGAEESFPETGVTMTFPATGDTNGMAYVVHEHAGKNYIYVGKVAGGKFSFKNTVGFSTFTVADGGLADAIAAAESGATVTIIADIEDVEVEVVKNLTITGSAKLNNVTINALNAAELTVSGLTFTGNSWINSAAKLSVSSVTANVAPSNSAYTNSRNAFISLGRNEGKDIEITVKNSTICTTNNADAINGWARIIKADISGNNFGSENAKYGYGTNVVKIMGVATNAELTFAENTVYADYNGFAIAPNNTRDNHYTVIFDGNKFFGTADFMWIETQGAAYNYTYAAVNATSDNTINGNAITAADIKTSETTWYCYAGLDVVTDENGKVIGGTLAYCAEDAIADGFELGEDGKVTATAPAYVAQIGEQKFETLDAALNAAKTMTGEVTIEIYDKVTLNQPLNGSYSSIKFVGKEADAEIYLDVQGYTTATGKQVFFEDLKLSKSKGGFVDNAGFMNLAFGIYDVAEVTYTNCTFLNGACASFGKVTFNGCTFYRSYDRYGLWAYGAADVVVDGCTFDDIRGIKLFSEGKKQVTDLTVKNTTFTEKVDGKPAIVLTDGKSVTLANNTYSSTGVFELDLEGKPNGTPVTSDVAPTCINDNGACGVLVDGKIYTTVAQAAEVATSGSTVTLLHESTETVELAEGVILNKNGFTAAGVTVAEPAYVAEVNGTQYKTLSEALGAVTADDQTVTILADVEENLTASLRGNIVSKDGAKVTITLTNSDWVYCPYSFVLGENITLNVPALFYYAGGAVIKGEVVAGAYYQRYAGTRLTIEAPGSMTVTSEMFYLRYVDGDRNAGIYIVGDNDDSTVELNLQVAYFYQGMINAKDANIKTAVYWQSNETDGQGSANLVLDNSKLNVTSNEQIAKATGNSTVTLKNGSAVTVAGGYQGVGITMDDTSTFTKNGVSIFQAKVNNVAYTTLADAVAAAESGDTIKLLDDLEIVGETFTIAADKSITLDMNGKKITVTDNKTDCYELFYNYGTLTVTGNGTIELTATTDRNWNASSSIFHNRGGELTIENGTFTHKGGTAMAFVLDNSANSYGDAETTIKDATLSSTYIAIRNRMEAFGENGGGNGIATLNVEGGTISGDSRAIWAQRSSGTAEKLATGAINISGGTIGLIDTPRSAGAVSMTTISGGTVAAFKGEVGELTVKGGNLETVTIMNTSGEVVPYVVNADGLYTNAVAAIDNVGYASLEAAIAAAQNGQTVTLMTDVALTDTLTIEKSITLDGNGHKLTPADSSKTYNSAIMAGDSGWGDDHGETITLKGLTFEGWNTKHGVVRAQGVTLNVDGCEFNGNSVSNEAYGVLSLNFADATVENSKFINNTSRAIDINYNGDNSNAVVTIDDCTFEGNSSTGAGIVVRNDGKKLIVKNSIFKNNSVNTNGNAATLYAGWGTNDEISGCTFENNTVITSHATTKRFASAIFCDGCAVSGNVFGEGNTATRNGESIATVVAVGAYYGAADISGNYWGGEAPVPGVDYTIEYTKNSVAVETYYAEYTAENGLTELTAIPAVAQVGKYSYATLEAAIDAANEGDTVTLLADIATSEEIINTKKITLDLNGKTITGTDNSTGSFGLITNKGELTITGNGKITLTATNDRDWNAYSSVISNQPGGKLTAESGTIEHLGGTDMAYGIDNLTNGKGTYAETIVNGGTVKSTYRAIRQFLNGIEAQNILTVNGGTIEGTNKSIWMQDPSANANTGKLTVGENATLNGDVYLFVTAGSTEWPVEVSIAADALKGKSTVVTGNVPAQYVVMNNNGTWGITAAVATVNGVGYATLAEAIAAAQAGETVKLLADVTVDSETYTIKGKAITLDLNGKKITVADNKQSGNYELFYIDSKDAALTVEDTSDEKNGSIELTAKYDRDWNAYSSIFHNRGGVLNIENGTFTHKGGTDMAYVVDNSGNWTNDATTNIYGGTLSSTYTAIRNRMDKSDNSGTVTVNVYGGTISGGSRAIWAQVSSADAAAPSYGNINIYDGKIEGLLYTSCNANGYSMTTIHGGTVAEFKGEVDELTVKGGTLNAVTILDTDGKTEVAYAINADGLYTRAVAEVDGTNYATLAEAIAAAEAGDTVTLMTDVTLTELVKIEKAITLDLGGKKITSTAQKAIEVYANATIQNGTIEAAQRCVDTRKAVELTLTDVTLIADEYIAAYGNPQPLTIGGSENGTKVNMNEVTINAGTTGYGIITFVDTELTATDSTISGYSALYVKPGSEGSEFKFVNSDLTGSTTNNDVEGNSFSTIAVRADDVTVNVDANSTVNATGNYCWAISMESKFANENGITGSTVNVAGTINGQILTSVDTSKNTISVKAEYADELATAGYACSAAAANGMITVLGKAVAKVGETLYTTLQAAVDAAERGAKITMVADTKEETVWLNKAVTLDLNGYTVEADYFVAMNGTQVLNTKTTGILKVSQEGLTLSITNTYIPVWNESNGYYLVDWAYGTKLDTSVAGLAKYTFIAIPRNGTTTNLEVVRLMQNGSLDNELEINVWLSWSNDLGEMTQTFRYNTDTISTVYTENPTAATRGTMFYLNVTGYENFDTVTMRAAVESARAMVDVANLKTIPNN